MNCKTTFLCVFLAAACLPGCRESKLPPPSPAPEPARVKAPDNSMPAPLFLQAAMEGKSEEIRTALANGTSVDLTGENGRTALMMSAFNGHLKTAQILIDAGAKTDAVDDIGRTALMYASTGPYADTVEMLLDNGAKVNRVDTGEKWTALMFAAAEGQEKVVKLLLKRGANPKLKDVDGDAAAAFALQRGHKELARILQTPDRTSL